MNIVRVLAAVLSCALVGGVAAQPAAPKPRPKPDALALHLSQSENPHIRPYAYALSSAKWQTRRIYVCWDTNAHHPIIGDHPCGIAYHALLDAGHDPEVTRAYGWAKLPAALNFCCKLLYSLPLGSSRRIFRGRPVGGFFQSSVRMTVLVRTVSPGR